MWSGAKITEYPTGNGLITAPTNKILQHSTLEKFFSLYPQLRKYYKIQQSVIELPEGGKVFIRSADDPYDIEGMTINWAWVDEAGNMKRAIFPVIKARVSTTRGQVMFTSTPYSLNWFYKELYVPWKKGEDDNIAIFTWKSVENPFFPEDYYEEEKRRLTAEEFAMRYEGEFTKMQGLVWDFPETQIIGDSEQLSRTLSYSEKVIAGVDWGFNNPSAIVVAIVKDATFYILEEWKESKKTTAEIIEQCKKYKKQYGIQLFLPDPAEPDRIEEMKRAGLNVGKTNKDITLGISHVNTLIREKRLYIHTRCSELLDELSQYHYEENKGEKNNTEKPVKDNDHLADAMRYMLMGWRPMKPEKKKALIVQRIEQRKKVLQNKKYE